MTSKPDRKASTDVALAIDPALDPATMTAAFRKFGRLHIPDFLTGPSATALYDHLNGEMLWTCSTLGGGQTVDVPVEMLDALPEIEVRKLRAFAHAEAGRGFHYMFDTVRITTMIDKGETLAEPYVALAGFLNGQPFLNFIRTLTGDARPTHVDAQATRYMPDHYLNAHDDRNEGRGRPYAYVLNLTAEWRTDWGGLLNFIDEDGHVAEAYRPTFNALNVFRVPQLHAVSYVAPFAGAPRLSITGWIRDDGPRTYR